MARTYAERNGLDFDETLTFQDLGVSAFRGKNADTGQLAAFHRAIEEGVVAHGSYLLVENLDRVSRQTPRKASRVLEDIVDKGVAVVTLSDGKVYTKQTLDNDPFAFVMVVLSFIRSHDESLQKGRRVRSAWESKRRTASDRPLTARCPAWLKLRPDRSEFDVLEDRARIVRRVYEMSAAGVGQHNIAMTLNDEQIPTWGDSGRTPAKHWRRSYIVKLLSNLAVIGTFVPHTLEIVDDKKARVAQQPVAGYFPAIVDEELYRKVAALRDGAPSPARGRHAGAELKNILGGLAKCWRCGGRMTRVTKGSAPKAGKPYLVCEAAKTGKRDESGRKVCEYRAVPIEPIEEGLRENIGLAIETAPTPGEGGSLDALIEGENVRVDNLGEQIAKIVDAIARGGSPALMEKLRSLERERDEAMSELSRLQDRRADAYGPFLTRRLMALIDALDAVPFDRKAANTRLREACSAIVVDPEEMTLTFEWKHGVTSGIPYGWPGVTDKPHRRPKRHGDA
jgi:DNA invertase Pin-like site-specific DNA recombinase